MTLRGPTPRRRRDEGRSPGRDRARPDQGAGRREHVVEEPVVEEPVVEQPVVEEPVAEEPVAERDEPPVMEEPAAEREEAGEHLQRRGSVLLRPRRPPDILGQRLLLRHTLLLLPLLAWWKT